MFLSIDLRSGVKDISSQSGKRKDSKFFCLISISCYFYIWLFEMCLKIKMINLELLKNKKSFKNNNWKYLFKNNSEKKIKSSEKIYKYLQNKVSTTIDVIYRAIYLKEYLTMFNWEKNKSSLL